MGSFIVSGVCLLGSLIALLPVMLSLGLLCKVIRCCLLEDFSFSNISAHVGLSVFPVCSVVVAFTCAFGLYFKLLNLLNFRCVEFISLILHFM